ncbi:unnamed protein product [Cyprideis torosa]|uniref:Uncharacterized protein n=1 Tax=Cyprideis torosa TaxID=163714 RepID=A0A7R8WIL3_9CRUS|nr:unnamed protein product [Cyprideis torosa]CAG0898063.1 unnamed protein product [Cyprideis torosa]
MKLFATLLVKQVYNVTLDALQVTLTFVVEVVLMLILRQSGIVQKIETTVVVGVGQIVFVQIVFWFSVQEVLMDFRLMCVVDENVVVVVFVRMFASAVMLFFEMFGVQVIKTFVVQKVVMNLFFVQIGFLIVQAQVSLVFEVFVVPTFVQMAETSVVQRVANTVRMKTVVGELVGLVSIPQISEQDDAVLVELCARALEAPTEFTSTEAALYQESSTDYTSSQEELSSSQGTTTPLEEQVQKLKREHPGLLMMVENGYKYCFFGEDARIASVALNIMVVPPKEDKKCSLETASVPVFRLRVHLKRLVMRGHKVGVVHQRRNPEGGNKLFIRELSGVFTRTTLIDSDEEDEGEWLLVLVADRQDKKIEIMGVMPTTGDFVTASFSESSSKQLESLLDVLRPGEMLFAEDLPNFARVQVEKYQSSRSGTIHLEIREAEDTLFNYASGFKRVMEFFASPENRHGRGIQVESDAATVIDIISFLQPLQMMALGALIGYLMEFDLHRAVRFKCDLSSLLQRCPFMNIPPSSLRCLEVFEAAVGIQGGRPVLAKESEGSLFEFLNRTRTPAGSRLLKRWLQRPLTSHGLLLQRQRMVTACVEELRAMENLKKTLRKLGDLERTVASIANLKVDFRVFQEEVLWRFLAQIVEEHTKLPDWLDELDIEAIRSQVDLPCPFAAVPPSVEAIDAELEVLEGSRRSALKKEIQSAVASADLVRASVHSRKYEWLIEVPSEHRSAVPATWNPLSSSRRICRYMSPSLASYLDGLASLRQKKQLEMEVVWQNFLGRLSSSLHLISDVIERVTKLDVFLALAEVAVEHDFCCPTLLPLSSLENQRIDIRCGFHPVVAASLSSSSAFIRNDIQMSARTGPLAYVITGPNMNGKSVLVKQVAITILLSQIGSFVPAESCVLSVFDGIFARMGAWDTLLQSSFEVEMRETAFFLQAASPKSFLIFDELGRGTSPDQGAAIACATLEYIVKDLSSLCLFVTHFPWVASLAQKLQPETEDDHLKNLVENRSMAFLLLEQDDEAEEDAEQLVFLYSLQPAALGKSYGMNVARLAGLPPQVLALAREKAATFERSSRRRTGPLAYVITGPNMNGKSVLVKQVAITILLSQIGSFVPAESCVLSVFDGIFVRMGAWDTLLQSSFEVEMRETAFFLQAASPKSFLIFDELGRGTSPDQGAAIACATLEYIVKDADGATAGGPHRLLHPGTAVEKDPHQ